MIKRVRTEFKSIKDGEKNSITLDTVVKNAYVELLGEGNPLPAKEMYFAPVNDKLSFKKNDQTTELKIPVVYEYVWSVGMTGKENNWFENLDQNDSMVLQLIFHTKKARFSIREIAVDLKQIPPFLKKDNKVANFIDKAKVVFSGAGKVMELTGLNIPGKILSALSELKINSVPTSEFPWYVKSFSFEQESGVEWHIPRSYWEKAGNLLVGTLAAYFVDSPVEKQPNETPANELNLAIEIRAFLRAASSDNKELWICPITKSKTIQLVITPRINDQK